MTLKTSLSSIHNNSKDLDKSSSKYRIIDDLMKDQNIVSEKETVHRRRDLDSLG